MNTVLYSAGLLELNSTMPGTFRGQEFKISLSYILLSVWKQKKQELHTKPNWKDIKQSRSGVSQDPIPLHSQIQIRDRTEEGTQTTHPALNRFFRKQELEQTRATSSSGKSCLGNTVPKYKAKGMQATGSYHNAAGRRGWLSSHPQVESTCLSDYESNISSLL